MRVRLNLKPGQQGTKHLTRQYGDRLVCVRYRYDEKTRKRYTTAEIIVDQEPWKPITTKPDTMVHVKVAFDETEIRHKVKQAGGKWSKSAKTWKLPYKIARSLGLKERIVTDDLGK